ncbi:MAG: 4Fe-4S single cluster domain-containing protein [Anaerolineaceae bacterium]|nr:4Fe-4S single cluster domain-containing protein [Anaerolineaceae bacterium]
MTAQYRQKNLILNIASVCTGTTALGPGLRAVVWVQGCPFHCRGCIAPDWIPFTPARLVNVNELVDELLGNPEVSGLTFSGGEPMKQAAGLAALAHIARQRRDLDIICFTGYRIEKLLAPPVDPGVQDLLSQVDVLIDGPYNARLNDNQGLRGSSNQRIHHLSLKLKEIDFETGKRQVEMQVGEGQILMVGIPPKGMDIAFVNVVESVQQKGLDLVKYERI